MSELYNGQDWATHAVGLLLSNTAGLYHQGRALAQEDPSGASLGEWVGTWFWGDLGALSGTDRGAVEGTRNDISRNDFDKIDWKSIAEDLGDE